MSNRIDISGKDKAEILAALFNRARPLGLGIFAFKNRIMEADEARLLLADEYKNAYFDYLEGRLMKVDLSGDDFSPAAYDRDNGDGAAETALRAAGLL